MRREDIDDGPGGVAVVERVNGLELRVHERRLDDGRKQVVVRTVPTRPAKHVPELAGGFTASRQ